MPKTVYSSMGIGNILSGFGGAPQKNLGYSPGIFRGRGGPRASLVPGGGGQTAGASPMMGGGGKDYVQGMDRSQPGGDTTLSRGPGFAELAGSRASSPIRQRNSSALDASQLQVPPMGSYQASGGPKSAYRAGALGSAIRNKRIPSYASSGLY